MKQYLSGTILILLSFFLTSCNLQESENDMSSVSEKEVVDSDSSISETNKQNNIPNQETNAEINTSSSSFQEIEISLDDFKNPPILTSFDNTLTDIYTIEGTGSTIVMIPGLGLSHSIYMETPDGRESWAEYFVNNGYSVGIMNPASNVGSKVDEKKQWNPTTIWKRWGFGESLDNPYADTRYPTESIDNFYDNLPYYGGAGSGKGVDMSDFTALNDYIDSQSNPVYIMFHSAAGNLVFDYAKKYPEKISGLIAIEPVGCPIDSENIPDTNFLAVYGDYIESRNQTGRFEACNAIAENLGNNGSMLYLPDMDINGNTHIMMQDTNNLDIAENILEWIQK